MTKQKIRAIALGMLLATSIIGAAYYMEFGSMTTAKLHEALQKDGMVAIKKAEYQKLKKAAQQNKTTAVSNNPQPPKTVYVYLLTIQKGERSIDFAQKLEEAHIIPDADAFVTYLQTRGLTRYIHAGTYKVHSEMSYEEIANLIAKKHR
ncbi:endolytic transglycosylase MltG [Parageobacillus thermoglucosidasius]|uniref:Endolytic transglycosylase MltG n=1 Tax=Parageobacillus thermoglucosidasius TaxID=1426 RepID=A0AB38QWA9_PARTM|nr:endolytic transglycosylase MltG [Parageobacillus thermoglucosidasius]UOE75391.1 endolytic transglycosylase MltG [Parageobacillus thermoglucosidasius]